MKTEIQVYAKEVAGIAADAVNRLRLIEPSAIASNEDNPDLWPTVGENYTRVWFQGGGATCFVAHDEDNWIRKMRRNGNGVATIAKWILTGYSCPALRHKVEQDPDYPIRKHISRIKY